MAYIPRLVERTLDDLLLTMGGVAIEGPMGAGKSELCRQRAKRVIQLDVDSNSRALVETEPSALLTGPYPTLFDEWQVAPGIWNQVRSHIDNPGGKGLFLLTGSATPETDSTRHPGIMRIGRIRLAPLTLAESSVSDSSVSLERLFNNEQAPNGNRQLVKGILPALHGIIRGGFPEVAHSELAQAQRSMKNYVEQIPSLNMAYLGDSRRSPALMSSILASLARLMGSELKIARVVRELADRGTEADNNTVSSYLHLLKKMFLIDEIEAFYPHLRSQVRVTSGRKIYFADPALPAALLRADPQSLLDDLETAGFLFENLVYRDLSVFMSILSGDITYYRDKSNLEVDFILRLADGRWAPIEVKLGASRAADGISNLHRLQAKIDTEKMPKPAFKAVITTGEYSYFDKKNDAWVISVYHLGI
jgi:predicted AAA+ superfamily ATPase